MRVSQYITLKHTLVAPASLWWTATFTYNPMDGLEGDILPYFLDDNTNYINMSTDTMNDFHEAVCGVRPP